MTKQKKASKVIIFFLHKSYFCTFPGEIFCRSRACNNKKRLPGRFGKPGNDYEYDEAGYSGDDYDEDYKDYDYDEVGYSDDDGGEYE